MYVEAECSPSVTDLVQTLLLAEVHSTHQKSAAVAGGEEVGRERRELNHEGGAACPPRTNKRQRRHAAEEDMLLGDRRRRPRIHSQNDWRQKNSSHASSAASFSWRGARRVFDVPFIKKAGIIREQEVSTLIE